ncbi:class II aldolase/adducin family protein [Phaeobacter gallaeciensis]|jgi:ribulose-5-phosphate 4-epimerase/fuculose-1-phosphate aldolase|uniref:class II aldolase/adducin family protein n=1 Tax=Phaeobacter gallaeciensis TaxID=60890 RepID=UPI00237FBB8F|nr:class II aldolase/adducin family protein [Phaeobacter gallaeciensis]MDE4306225.1 class II aldolase/adducin family protein [Phaeobacter gallaeciensis]MDE4310705.1 class II aldolase/adducin family protein [Phaeobacter gallaeciensis]MDE4315112.1 class II aldolase/adducin family protein [Phaeobacter gallaeciensis]MDE4319619.1 class II aldolase/adducin family protein [Phaeobacter gallaeciensis]MDE4324061.1 class II aldolase/adducin family protein [Phaeobacter gallaeciensis]
MTIATPLPDAEATLRTDLADAFRICHMLGWSESVGNHFSAAVSADGQQFLLNAKWQHFDTIAPEDLLLLDSRTKETPATADASAWCVHGTLHRRLPEARVVLHAHSPYATALACLKDPTMVPIDNNTARFYGRTAYDLSFGGIADAAEEGERLADAIGDKSVLVMGNHGVTIVGDTVAEAFEDLYFFEKAAQTLILARSDGSPLAVLSDAVAQNTADGWRAYRGMAEKHFSYLCSVLTQRQR